MRAHYLVTVDMDPARAHEDNPPEAVPESLRREIETTLKVESAVFGIEAVRVQRVTFRGDGELSGEVTLLARGEQP